MKRLILCLAVLALAAPSLARADTTTYEPAYGLGPQGGDSNNTFMVDPETGSMTVIRHQAAGISGGLGCGGSGAFASFQVTHTATEPVTSVTVAFEDALVDPYTFVNIAVRSGDSFIGGAIVRGIITGSDSITAPIWEPAAGEIVVWFGIQISSACPNVDVGSARFTSVTVTEG